MSSEIKENQNCIKVKRTGFRPQATVIISAVILAVTIIVFVFWGLFFNNSLENKTWLLSYTIGGKDCSLGLSFDGENECRLYYGGFTYKGRYSTSNGLNGKENLSIELTEYGSPMFSNEYTYNITGNSFTGCRMTLTDLSGDNLIYSITGIDKDSADLKCDYVEENGKKYYQYTLSASDGYEPKYEHYSDKKTDPAILGIWYCKKDDLVFDHTFAFYDDGTYIITYRDCEFRGCYSAADGKCKFNLVFGNGSVSDNEMSYSLKDGKLTITINDVPDVYEKTDSLTVFDTGIK